MEAESKSPHKVPQWRIKFQSGNISRIGRRNRMVSVVWTMERDCRYTLSAEYWFFRPCFSAKPHPSRGQAHRIASTCVRGAISSPRRSRSPTIASIMHEMPGIVVVADLIRDGAIYEVSRGLHNLFFCFENSYIAIGRHML